MRCKHAWVSVLVTILVAVPVRGHEEDEKNNNDKKPVAGKADVLKLIPKKFATLVSVDSDRRAVQVRFDDEQETKSWNVEPDAELKINGWWGRLEHFKKGDRVWVWLALNREKKPKSILMLADEISEQDIHGLPHKVTGVDRSSGTITVESKVGGTRTLKTGLLTFTDVKDKHLSIQSAGEIIRILADEGQVNALREEQKNRMRELWRTEGLPATVSFLHAFSGEMEVVLDHEAKRWGRYLKNGDSVTLDLSKPVRAEVKHVRPWRERTVLRLVTESGVDQLDMSLGQRIDVRVPEPPKEIQDSELPTDIGRRTEKKDRLDWFLASGYCPCKVGDDGCTGMFYSLASCNVNSCGMPNNIRGKIGAMIDEGLDDKAIWTKLKETSGSDIIRQHLLH